MGLSELHLIISISHIHRQEQIVKRNAYGNHQNNEDENFIISQNKGKTGKKKTQTFTILILRNGRRKSKDHEKEKKNHLFGKKKIVTKKMGMGLDPTSLVIEAHREEGQEYMTLKKMRNSGD
jgi:hypothetical protein